jgi:hypothetical protein
MPSGENMTDAEYEQCCFSITCSTDQLAVVHCLRALCEFAAEDVRPQIGWGGTKAREWEKAGNRITLRFTSPSSRQKFVDAAQRLLPQESWGEVSRSDADPAKRQRPLRRH